MTTQSTFVTIITQAVDGSHLYMQCQCPDNLGAIETIERYVLERQQQHFHMMESAAKRGQASIESAARQAPRSFVVVVGSKRPVVFDVGYSTEALQDLYHTLYRFQS